MNPTPDPTPVPPSDSAPPSPPSVGVRVEIDEAKFLTAMEQVVERVSRQVEHDARGRAEPSPLLPVDEVAFASAVAEMRAQLLADVGARFDAAVAAIRRC